MTIQDRKSHFIKLGNFLRQFNRNEITRNEEIPLNDRFFQVLNEQIDLAVHHNGWFTKENVLFSIEQWSNALTEENLTKWLTPYSFKDDSSKMVGIVMAGNIPLVGFHDFLSVLISGNKVLIKQSSNDQKILPILADYLIALEPEYKGRIIFTEGRMENFDAVIATGSNNTSRYFEYYFSKSPSIIRKNRNSIAILTGNETKKELENLGEDIFRYFGLGCRNVSKLYVPEGYDFDTFYKALQPWEHLMNHAKYANNYDYNKAVYLMSEFKILDNGFLTLKEDTSFGSPIATLFFQTYSSTASLTKDLEENSENLQCIISNATDVSGLQFGSSQHPQLWDYADNVDTLAFLEKI